MAELGKFDVSQNVTFNPPITFDALTGLVRSSVNTVAGENFILQEAVSPPHKGNIILGKAALYPCNDVQVTSKPQTPKDWLLDIVHTAEISATDWQQGTLEIAPENPEQQKVNAVMDFAKRIIEAANQRE